MKRLLVYSHSTCGLGNRVASCQLSAAERILDQKVKPKIPRYPGFMSFVGLSYLVVCSDVVGLENLPLNETVQIASIHDEPEANVNIALESWDAKVIASDTKKSQISSEKAIDGDIETYWESQSTVGEKYFEIRWDSPQLIKTIKFRVNSFLAGTDCHIDVYDDRKSAFIPRTTLRIGPNLGLGQDGEPILPEGKAIFGGNPLETSRIRLVFPPVDPMPTNGDGLRIHDLKVFSLYDMRTDGRNRHGDSFEVTQKNISVKPGSLYKGTVEVKALAKPKANYTFFVRIYDKEGGDEETEFRIAEVQFRNTKVTKRWAANEKRKIPFELWVPDSAPHGEYELRFEMRGQNGSPKISGGLATEKSELGLSKLGSATIDRYGNAKRYGVNPLDFSVNYQARIGKRSGKNTLLINNKPTPAVFYAVRRQDYDTIHQYAQTTGNHLYRVSTAGPIVNKRSAQERHVDKTVINGLERKVNRVLNVDPDAKFIVGVSLRVVGSWTAANNGDEGEPDERPHLASGETVENHSMYSQIWKEDAQWALSRLIKNMKSRNWGKRVIGIHLAGGGGGEFSSNEGKLNTGENDPNIEVREANRLANRRINEFGDFNPQAITQFRAWLKKKYGTVGALQDAWKDAWKQSYPVNFKNAIYSSDAMLAETSDGFFRDIREDMDSIDYFTFRSEYLMETIDSFAETVKKSFALQDGSLFYKNDVLVGAWLGYVSALMNQKPGLAIHRAYGSFEKLIDSKNFDYFSVPNSYAHRRQGTAYAVNAAISSLDAHGKLFISELDARTHHALNPREKYEHRSQEESNEIALRDIGAACAMGVGSWRVDFSKSGLFGQESIPWFTDPDHLERDQFNYQLSNELITEPRERIAEIAVIIDYDAPKYTDLYTSVPTYNMFERFLGTEMNKVGAPFDIYTLGDLELPQVKNDYKMYIFLNTHHLSPSIRSTIRDDYQKDDKVLLWMWAPGYVQNNRKSIRYLEQITGFNMRMTKQWNGFDVGVGTDVFRIEDWPGSEHRNFYEKRLSPTFWPDSQIGMTVLGRYQEVEKPDPTRKSGPAILINKPAVAVKEISRTDVNPAETYYSVYSGIPFMPAKLVRKIAKDHDIHIYYETDDTYVYANEDLVVLHTGATMQHGTLNFPTPKKIYNAYQGNYLNGRESTKSLKMTIPAYTTKIFCLID